MRSPYPFALLLSSFIFNQVNAQDTVRIDNQTYTNYEKVLYQKSKLYSETSTEIWSKKNLKIYLVTLKENDQVVSNAMLFKSRIRDGQIHIIPIDSQSYLDMDEINSLIQALHFFVQSKPKQSSLDSKTVTFNSRGNVYAGCYVNKKNWRVAITTDTGNWDAYTYLNEEQVKELIEVLTPHRLN